MDTLRSILTVALSVAAVAMTGAATAQDQAELNPLLLKVNGEPVYAADVSLIIQGVSAQQRQAGNQLSDEQLVELATRRAIEQKLLAQEARRLGIEPDSLRIGEAMTTMVKHAGSRQALDANLSGAGTSYERVVENVRDMELARAYIETQIRPKVTVTEEEIEAHYESTPEAFGTPERVRARHILIELVPEADADNERFAREEAEQARKRVLAGEDFAAVASEVSDCQSAPHGGDLGVFAPATMVRPFAEALATLEPGEISEIVRTEFGFHVIRLEERLPGGTAPFAEVHDRVEAALLMQKIALAVAETVERLRDAATIEEILKD